MGASPSTAQVVKACDVATKIYMNVPVNGDYNADLSHNDGEVHLLICALDYKQTDNSLTCSLDGKNVEELARVCGVRDVTAMYDEECTSEAVSRAIQQVGSRCSEGDYFVFYYSGHGTNLADQSGDEADGQDEALCFVTPDGQINYESCMSDDTFAELVTQHVPGGCRCLILTDCCHSGTIADLEKDIWSDHEAISVTGCMDSQTSGDMGKGGIFTHSMLVAIQKLVEGGDEEFSVGMLYNTTLQYDKRIFDSPQDISIQCTANMKPDGMAWPFVPPDSYVSPMMKAKRDLHIENEDDDEGAIHSNPSAMQASGVSPDIAAHIASLSDDKLDINDVKAAAKIAGCNVM